MHDGAILTLRIDGQLARETNMRLSGGAQSLRVDRPRTLTFVTLLAVTMLLGVACSGDDSDDSTLTPTVMPETEVAPGVFIHTETSPPPPTGATALSEYYVFRSTDAGTGVVVGAALNAPQSESVDLGFYTYDEFGQWNGVIGVIQLLEDGTVLKGAFPEVPANVMVLFWPEGKE